MLVTYSTLVAFKTVNKILVLSAESPDMITFFLNGPPLALNFAGLYLALFSLHRFPCMKSKRVVLFIFLNTDYSIKLHSYAIYVPFKLLHPA